jgi:hypothetical protein
MAAAAMATTISATRSEKRFKNQQEEIGRRKTADLFLGCTEVGRQCRPPSSLLVLKAE